VLTQPLCLPARCPPFASGPGPPYLPSMHGVCQRHRRWGCTQPCHRTQKYCYRHVRIRTWCQEMRRYDLGLAEQVRSCVAAPAVYADMLESAELRCCECGEELTVEPCKYNTVRIVRVRANEPYIIQTDSGFDRCFELICSTCPLGKSLEQ